MFEKLKTILEKIEGLEVRYDEPLSKYTSFRIGGPADIFLIPHNYLALQETLTGLSKQEAPFFILGRGSNLIISDLGIRGVVIYTGELKNVTINGNRIIAETGISLSALANKALEAGLTGLEFASGIPGSLGGALYMNAGAYDGEMKDVVEEVVALTYSGQEITLSREDLAFSYRYSILQERELIAARATLLLQPGNRDEIKRKMTGLNKKRKEKQPLEYPSAGSIFKRPKGYYSGPLIEKAGMKGARIGDAQVSRKHAGFIINLGKATARDVLSLIHRVQEEVYKISGVKLEVEPKIVGEFRDKKPITNKKGEP